MCVEKTAHERPRAVAGFVKTAMVGWNSYPKGHPSPANALVRKDNPDMPNDMMVSMKLLVPTMVDLRSTCTSQPVRDLRIMP